MTSDRKMATIRMIDDLQPIPGADRIEVATVGGWKVVVGKGNFNVGDLGIFCEIDSWIPTSLDPSLSRGQEPKEYNGVKGEKLKTIRLKKQISQGMMIPLTPDILEKFAYEVPEIGWYVFTDETLTDALIIDRINMPDLSKIDLSNALGIQKWERDLEPELVGKAIGDFPSFISKTYQERAQNIPEEIFNEHKYTRYEVTLKMNGESMTVFKKDGVLGVATKNLNLDMSNTDMKLIKFARESGLLDDVNSSFEDFAIQGEICGPGILKNKESLDDLTFFCFDMQDITTRSKFDPVSRKRAFSLCVSDRVKHVPILHTNVTLEDLGIHNMEDLLSFAQQPGYNSKYAEGVVFKSEDGQFSFKVISNKYLEKEE